MVVRLNQWECWNLPYNKSVHSCLKPSSYFLHMQMSQLWFCKLNSSELFVANLWHQNSHCIRYEPGWDHSWFTKIFVELLYRPLLVSQWIKPKHHNIYTLPFWSSVSMAIVFQILPWLSVIINPVLYKGYSRHIRTYITFWICHPKFVFLLKKIAPKNNLQDGWLMFL